MLFSSHWMHNKTIFLYGESFLQWINFGFALVTLAVRQRFGKILLEWAKLYWSTDVVLIWKIKADLLIGYFVVQQMRVWQWGTGLIKCKHKNAVWLHQYCCCCGKLMCSSTCTMFVLWEMAWRHWPGKTVLWAFSSPSFLCVFALLL